MKITKRQLRQIIKEETAKLQEQDGMSRMSRQHIENMQYDFEKAISSKLGLENRFWYRDDDTVLAVMEMLDDLKRTIAEYSRM